MSKGRIAFIDYVAYAGTRGLRVGRVWLRWLDESAPIPDHVVRVSGSDQPVLIRQSLPRDGPRARRPQGLGATPTAPISTLDDRPC